MLDLGWNVTVVVNYDARRCCYDVVATHGNFYCMERVAESQLQAPALKPDIQNIVDGMVRQFDAAFRRYQAQANVLFQARSNVNTFPGAMVYNTATSTGLGPLMATTSSGIGRSSTSWVIANSGIEEPRDVRGLMAASDIVEEYISFMEGAGVEKPLEAPARAFTLWLAYEAEVTESDEGQEGETAKGLFEEIMKTTGVMMGGGSGAGSDTDNGHPAA